MAGGVLMLTGHVERYLSLRQTLGYKLRNTLCNLRAFASFAVERGDTHVCVSTAVDWATEGISPYNRHIRLRDVALLARFLHAEDPLHEVPSNPFHAPTRRPLPYIYAPEEIVQLVGAVARLRESYPLRRRVYATLFGLIAATGLRISEALDLRFHDILPDGVLHIQRTKLVRAAWSLYIPRRPMPLTVICKSAASWPSPMTMCSCRQEISESPPARWSTPSAGFVCLRGLPLLGHVHLVSTT